MTKICLSGKYESVALKEGSTEMHAGTAMTTMKNEARERLRTSAEYHPEEKWPGAYVAPIRRNC